MKRYVEVLPFCPFVNGQCIGDGWQWDKKTIHPCLFFDENAAMIGKEPCLMLRAARTICDHDKPESHPETDLPWTVEEEEK